MIFFYFTPQFDAPLWSLTIITITISIIPIRPRAREGEVLRSTEQRLPSTSLTAIRNQIILITMRMMNHWWSVDRHCYRYWCLFSTGWLRDQAGVSEKHLEAHRRAGHFADWLIDRGLWTHDHRNRHVDHHHDQVTAMIERMDVDGDGKLNKEEFEKLMAKAKK